MIKLSDTAKEKLKVKVRELMITTMDYCAESIETQNKSIEIFTIISEDINRALKQNEIEIIKLWAEAMIKELIYCYTKEDKEKAYSFYFNIIGGIIYG
jgi:hypothetical protein